MIGVVVPSISSKSALVPAGMDTVAIFRRLQLVSLTLALYSGDALLSPGRQSWQVESYQTLTRCSECSSRLDDGGGLTSYLHHGEVLAGARAMHMFQTVSSGLGVCTCSRRRGALLNTVWKNTGNEEEHAENKTTSARR